MSARDQTVCSFCGKSAREVAVLIKGRAESNICDEYVELCHAIVVEQMGPAATKVQPDDDRGQTLPDRAT